ncbi:MAG: hypothetical protein ACHP8A_20730 [Terriglobales bacterium]
MDGREFSAKSKSPPSRKVREKDGAPGALGIFAPQLFAKAAKNGTPWILSEVDFRGDGLARHAFG